MSNYSHSRARAANTPWIVWAVLFVLIAGTSLLAAPQVTSATASRSVVEVGRWRMESNAWVNLHQRLLYEASFTEPPPAALSGADLDAWKACVDAYRAFVKKRSPIDDAELVALEAALSAIEDAQLPASVPKPAADALTKAMPLYRAAQWEQDDRANRFWIAVAEPLLASAGEELAEANSKAYGKPFPKHIQVEVTTYGWEFGAYTTGEGDHAHVVIASIVPGNQGFAALEALMHEPAHAIVDPNSGAIGLEINQAANALGMKPPHGLWHAVLFYTAGELTRRALAERGVSGYEPVVLQMYARGFARFQHPLEEHWQAFLDGRISRTEALKRIVGDLGETKK